MRALIIENHARMVELLAEGLDRRGFAADIAANLADAEAALSSASHDVIVLDLGLPDGDGLAWLEDRRRHGPLPPVLILTARGALKDRVTGLNAGADDYLVKPVDLDELAARLRALLRRPGNRIDPVLTVGRLSFNTADRTATIEGRRIALFRREADLLELLMRRAGAVVRRETIEEALYSFNEPVTGNAVEAVVSRLRRKLEQAGLSGALQTVRGLGYMLRDAGA